MTSFITLPRNKEVSEVNWFKKLSDWFCSRFSHCQKYTQEVDLSLLRQKEPKELNTDLSLLAENEQERNNSAHLDAYSIALTEYQQERQAYQTYQQNNQLKEAQEMARVATEHRWQLINYLIEREKYPEFLNLWAIDSHQAWDFALNNGATYEMLIHFYGA